MKHLRLLWIAMIAVAGLSVCFAARDVRPAQMQAFHAAAPAVPPAMRLALSASDGERQPSGRVVYPYSVVPGGIASLAELRAAIARDPVVAAHYAAFDMSKARLAHADRERMVYVSYRRGNQLYWTTHKLKLARGEALITDGVITARARCGNQVRETPSPEASPDEPSAKTLDTPQPVEATSTWLYNPDQFNQADWGSDLAVIWQPASPPAPAPPQLIDSPGPGPAHLPLFLPPAGARSTSPLANSPNTPGVPPVVPVPEPSTFALLLTALPAIWVFRKRKG